MRKHSAFVAGAVGKARYRSAIGGSVLSTRTVGNCQSVFVDTDAIRAFVTGRSVPVGIGRSISVYRNTVTHP